MTWKSTGLHLLRIVGITCGYLSIGCIFYHLVEEKDCESSDVPDCKESWTLIDSWYFSAVTISTVGYGDLTPSSKGSKAFTIVYIFVGITVVFSEIASGFSGVLEKIADNGMSMTMSLLNDMDGMADFVGPPPALVFWTKNLVPWLVLAIIFQLFSALIFNATEPDLTYFDTFYHSFVTATTVGYGDVPLTTQKSRLFASFHIIMSVTTFGALVGRVQELISIRNSEIKRHEMLECQFSEKWIESVCEEMDHAEEGTDGVDKTEFVVGMLTRLGVELCGEPLNWNDVKPILKQFEDADKNDDGRLNKDDLQNIMMARKRAVEAKRESLCKQGAAGKAVRAVNKVAPADLSDKGEAQTLAPPS